MSKYRVRPFDLNAVNTYPLKERDSKVSVDNFCRPHEKGSTVSEFLGNLCYKMGARDDLWRNKHLDVLVYHVEEFHE